ncbi:hypothetical protein CKO28_00290 [Rhodovibrio sodomensis]|uniref:Uncharacterized protein n=1 Tax=Rhodovibrio sodomensis TaxID=1088 RepID=A0ABS1D7S9_9PROT|nr:hypothetical protein [Rhodovibrio sodomensis]MBK1666478.1 hypothetical protein [Rhodovibrio sodomensis]
MHDIVLNWSRDADGVARAVNAAGSEYAIRPGRGELGTTYLVEANGEIARTALSREAALQEVRRLNALELALTSDARALTCRQIYDARTAAAAEHQRLSRTCETHGVPSDLDPIAATLRRLERLLAELGASFRGKAYAAPALPA